MPATVLLARDAKSRGVAETSTPRTVSSIRDIALAPGGLFVGQVLDESMRPVRGVKIAVQAEGHTAATTETDANGVFAVAGLRGGLHQVVTAESVQPCRLWTAGTAPPRAESQLRFVPGQATVVRGQWVQPPPPGWQALATNPWVIGGVVATAVAVPVVLNNIDDDDSGS